MKVTNNHYIKDDIKYDRITKILGYLENPILVKWKLKNLEVGYKEIIIEIFNDLTRDYPFDNIIPEHLINSLDSLILERHLKTWEKITKEATDIGTEVHNIIENYLKDGIMMLSKNNDIVNRCLTAFKSWYNTVILKPIELELTQFDEVNQVAGTCDFIGKVDGVMTLLDWKTSSHIYPNYWIQVNLYAHLYNRTAKRKIKQVGILRMDKKSGYGEYIVKPLDKQMVKRFYNILDLVRLSKGE